MAAYFVEVGLVLAVAPWTALWERNYFATAWPHVRLWMDLGLVRGAVSAAGLVTIVAGLTDLYVLFSRHEPRLEPPQGGSAM